MKLSSSTDTCPTVCWASHLGLTCPWGGDGLCALWTVQRPAGGAHLPGVPGSVPGPPPAPLRTQLLQELPGSAQATSRAGTSALSGVPGQPPLQHQLSEELQARQHRRRLPPPAQSRRLRLLREVQGNAVLLPGCPTGRQGFFGSLWLLPPSGVHLRTFQRRGLGSLWGRRRPAGRGCQVRDQDVSEVRGLHVSGTRQAPPGAAGLPGAPPHRAHERPLEEEVPRPRRDLPVTVVLAVVSNNQMFEFSVLLWRCCMNPVCRGRYYCMDDKTCVCNACTIEGGHSGHTIKTLKNTMKDLKVQFWCRRPPLTSRSKTFKES